MNEEETVDIAEAEEIFERVMESPDSERSRILDEIAGSDYKVIKAMRLGVTPEELYPGITGWYKERVDRLNEIEAIYAAGAAVEEPENTAD
jgi:hypothetical protein